MITADSPASCLTRVYRIGFQPQLAVRQFEFLKQVTSSPRPPLPHFYPKSVLRDHGFSTCALKELQELLWRGSDPPTLSSFPCPANRAVLTWLGLHIGLPDRCLNQEFYSLNLKITQLDHFWGPFLRSFML